MKASASFRGKKLLAKINDEGAKNNGFLSLSNGLLGIDYTTV